MVVYKYLAMVALLPLVPQEPAGDLLRREGWRGVVAVADLGENAKADLQGIAAGKDADLAFLARAALAKTREPRGRERAHPCGLGGFAKGRHTRP